MIVNFLCQNAQKGWILLCLTSDQKSNELSLFTELQVRCLVFEFCQ